MAGRAPRALVPSRYFSMSEFICGSALLTATATHSAGSGETILRGKTFQEYLGPLWDVLKNKYSEWLDATYSMSLSRIPCLLPDRSI